MPELTEILQDLPRVEARGDFTDQVMRRVSGRSSHSRRRWMAAAAAIIAVVSLLAEHQIREERRMEHLRAEHRALAAEIAQLKQMSAPNDDHVYLGGTDRVDYVLDLRPSTAVPAAASAEPDQHAD